MERTFRLRSAVLIQGIVVTLLFLLVTIGHACLTLLGNPEEHGFKGPQSPVILAGIGVALYGTMLIGSVYTLIAYRVERFSVRGMTFEVKSVVKTCRFDAAEVQKLVWKARSRSIVFRLLGKQATIG